MKHPHNQHLVLSHTAQQTILADIVQRSQIEACGVLLGTIDQDGHWNVAQAHPLTNSAASPVYFEFEPGELLEVELSQPDQIIGVYHSHPTGFPRASQTDRDNMQRVNQQQHIPWGLADRQWPLRCHVSPKSASRTLCRPLDRLSSLRQRWIRDGVRMPG